MFSLCCHSAVISARQRFCSAPPQHLSSGCLTLSFQILLAVSFKLKAPISWTTSHDDLLPGLIPLKIHTMTIAWTSVHSLEFHLPEYKYKCTQQQQQQKRKIKLLSHFAVEMWSHYLGDTCRLVNFDGESGRGKHKISVIYLGKKTAPSCGLFCYFYSETHPSAITSLCSAVCELLSYSVSRSLRQWRILSLSIFICVRKAWIIWIMNLLFSYKILFPPIYFLVCQTLFIN